MSINKLEQIITQLRDANLRSQAHIAIRLMPEAISTIVGVVKEIQAHVAMIENGNSLLMAEITGLKSEIQALKNRSANIVSDGSVKATLPKPVAKTVAKKIVKTVEAKVAEADESKPRRGRPPKSAS